MVIFGKNRAKFQKIWVLKEHTSFVFLKNKWEEHSGRGNGIDQRMRCLACVGTDDLASWQGAWGLAVRDEITRGGVRPGGALSARLRKVDLILQWTLKVYRQVPKVGLLELQYCVDFLKTLHMVSF